MVNLYILDDEHNIIALPTDNPENILKWGHFMEEVDKRCVAVTDVGIYRVLTVFMGIDHNYGFADGAPILFETMVFGGVDDILADLYQERYATWDEAVAGHETVVKTIKKHIKN